MNADALLGLLARVRTLTFTASSPRPGGWNGTGSGGVAVERRMPDVVVFRESGRWTTAEGRAFAFGNTYRWTHDGDAVRLEHLRFGDGSPVRLFDFVGVDESRWASASAHACGADCYAATLVVEGDAIRVSWDVSGPTKDARIEYVYTTGVT